MASAIKMWLRNGEFWSLRSDGKVIRLHELEDDLNPDFIEDSDYVQDTYDYVIKLDTTKMYKFAYGKKIIATVKRGLKACQTDGIYDVEVRSKRKQELIIRVQRLGSRICVFNSEFKEVVELDLHLNITDYTDTLYRDFIQELVNDIKKRKDAVVKEESKRDLLIRMYGNDFLEKEKFLLQYYEKIEYKNLGAAKLYKLLAYVAESHRLLTKVLNVGVYPKLRYLELERAVKRNWGYFYHDLGVKMRLLDSHPVNILATYTHEYGHYIHFYLTRINKHGRHNDSVFKEMVRQVKRMETVEFIRHNETNDTYRRYLLKEVEIIARLFEHYGLRMYLERKYIPNIDPLTDHKQSIMFKPQEIEVFKHYMTQLKI